MMYNIWSVNEKDWGFELTDGLFEGVVIQVENIDVKDAETGQISIDYHAVFIPAHLSEEDIGSDNFQNVMNQVINKFLMDAIQDHEQNRNNNT